MDTIGELDGLQVGSVLAEKMVGAPAAPSSSRADSSFRKTLVAKLAVHVVKPKGWQRISLFTAGAAPGQPILQPF